MVMVSVMVMVMVRVRVRVRVRLYGLPAIDPQVPPLIHKPVVIHPIDW